jgi:branched-chain amino acid transport system substrate-binding protein
MVKKRQNLILLMIMIQLFIIPTLGPYRNIENINACNDIPSLADVSVGSYIVPGVLIPPSDLIKIGILGDMKDISGIHAWNGAFLAAKEINQAGGISIGGSRYKIGLVSKDTDEANYILDITKAVTAAEQMVNLYAPDFIIGGYRLEALAVYLEVIMDNHVPFISIGVDSDIHCQQVLDNYARYKYFFRTMPINSSSFFSEFIDYIISLSSYLGTVYGGTVDKVAILNEDLSWSVPWSAALNYYLPLYGLTVVEDIEFSPTVTAPEMAAYWAQIDAAGAQITIPLIKTEAGIIMMKEYAVLQPGCLVVGIDKLSQFEMTWDDTGGACQYEVIPQPIYKTNKTSLTLPFWNSFIDMYDEEPFYTGAGAYDSIKLLIEAVNETQSLNPDTIIVKLEDYDHTTPFHGASGLIAFTPSHDLVEGWPYNTYLFCQWNSYGTKEVLPSWGSVYPDSIVTGGLKIPYWGINNLTGPQTLPGAFTLISDASVHDYDGSFNLIWSNSVGANSYSIYYSHQLNLTRLVKIADNAISPFKISNLMTDDYLFVIVAHNSVGEAISNSIYVNVERPRPGGFILYPNSEDPDQDGQFDLTWTNSVGADNYSVYGDYSYITEIDQSLTLMADQTGVSPYNISGLREGHYYFAVEAHNKTGKTLSNCIEVVVQFPPAPEPEPTPPVIPGYNLYVIISMICIVSIILNKKRHK